MFFWLWGMWDFSSPTRSWTCTPSIGKQSLNQWTAREVPNIPLYWIKLVFLKFFNIFLSLSLPPSSLPPFNSSFQCVLMVLGTGAMEINTIQSVSSRRIISRKAGRHVKKCHNSVWCKGDNDHFFLTGAVVSDISTEHSTSQLEQKQWGIFMEGLFRKKNSICREQNFRTVASNDLVICNWLYSIT